MGAEPPFLYDPPSRYSNSYAFNPKAVSQASATPPKPRQKQEGPLVNFNQHPDSYLILPYGNTTAKPMSPRTKTKVRYSRFVLLLLRCCELLGAIGLFICTICVRGLENTTGWILRVPPAFAIFHSIYAIYHLGRRASGRTPGSSASYMLFASAADTFLVPFYVFTALLSNTEYQARRANSDNLHWRTVFNNDLDANDVPTSKVIRAVFLFGVTNGALHIATLLLSLYLAVMFRRITKLPPDMNPLESNLTSRHKKKNSSISHKHLSTSTIDTVDSGSPRDSPRSSQLIEDEKRTVPFMHTRVDSFNSPRASRADLPSQIASARSSKTDLARSQWGKKSPTKRSSHFIESRSIHDTDSPLQPGATRHRGSKSSLLTDNWYVHVPLTDDSEDIVQQKRAISNVSSMNAVDHEYAQRAGDYEPLSQPYDDENDAQKDNMLAPHPLGMNPPTPDPHSYGKELNIREKQQSSNEINVNVKKSSAIKTRYYGDLKPGTPPVMMGTCVDLPRDGESRVISSGNDWNEGINEKPTVRGREVSGKIAEEGRSPGWSWRRGKGRA